MSTIKATNIKLKRAYDPPASTDGIRILVDRLWPRGVKKADVALDLWEKELAPSVALRKWFGHDPARWEEFCARYEAEVSQHPEELKQLRAHGAQGSCYASVFRARRAAQQCGRVATYYPQVEKYRCAYGGVARALAVLPGKRLQG